MITYRKRIAENMETLWEPKPDPKRLNKGFLIGGLIGLIVIGALIWVATLRPSMEDQKQSVLEGSSREGDPDFEAITRDIIISTDDRTVESPNGFGHISMYIVGKIRNKGTRVINGLEVNVAVVDRFDQVLKEKRVLVVPTQVESLKPNETIPITLSIDGFRQDQDRANIRWKVTAIRTQG